MNILVFGAGAIGSFFGGILSKNENVFLVGRKSHVSKINKNGLKITGKTNLKVNVESFEKIEDVNENIDLVLLTVKSYDTVDACKILKKAVSENTTILSMQNGLDNIEKIKKFFDKKDIIFGVTTNGVVFEKEGLVNHTGVGYTTLGELDGSKTKRIEKIISVFNKSKIKTTFNSNIEKEIWIKGIVNSSINPLTAFFECKNGYLIKNPVLEKIVEKICFESTNISKSFGIDLSFSEMLDRTKMVIDDTKDNYSSMLQSFKKNKPLEIDSINGYLVNAGKKNKVYTIFNEMLVHSVNNMKNK